MLLCIAAFFSKPVACEDGFLAFYRDEARKKCKPKTKAQVDAEYQDFMIDTAADIDGLVQASMNVKSSGPIEYMPFRTCYETSVGPSPICYDGVCNWLFAAGFMSRRWLAATHIHASTIQEHLGDGKIVPTAEWGILGRGYIWNVSKSTERETCHWGFRWAMAVPSGATTQAKGASPMKMMAPTATEFSNFSVSAIFWNQPKNTAALTAK